MKDKIVSPLTMGDTIILLSILVSLSIRLSDPTAPICSNLSRRLLFHPSQPSSSQNNMLNKYW